jgi:hypothetical protein
MITFKKLNDLKFLRDEWELGTCQNVSANFPKNWAFKKHLEIFVL